MKRHNFIKSYRLIVLILCLFIITSFTYTNTLEEVRAIVSEYYGGGSIPSNVWSAGTVEDILNALVDPYSGYFSAEEYQVFLNSINMELVGIGITAEQVPDGILVISVIDGSGAMRAGLKIGDIITAADGVSLSGTTLEAGIQMLRGEEGTTVHLTIKRELMVFTVDILRSKLALPTLEWEVINNNTGYIRINSFGEDTGTKFASALKSLSDKDLAGYIVDLRNNGGGFVNTALEIAGFFIGGKRAVTFKGASDVSFSYNAVPPERMIDKPVVFLANQYSASASELLMAAVKDYKKGLIIGEKSFGKGSMQDFFELSNNDILKLTVAKFYSPYGNPVDKVGVKADIQVIDALVEQAALLFMGSSGDNADKTGFIRYTAGDMEYEIDLRDARTLNNWAAYLQIMEDFRKSNGKITIGNGKGWSDLPKTYWDKPWLLLYPDYKELPRLMEVPDNKQFRISFNKPTNVNQLAEGDIELIYSTTGKRVKLHYMQIDETSIVAVPDEALMKGQTYYLAIHPGIRDEAGYRMLQGTIVQVNVR